MKFGDTRGPTSRWAEAMLREVPLGQLSGLLEQLGSSPVALGDACGNGCGSGCGNNCRRPIDMFGHTQLSQDDLEQLVQDKAALQQEIAQHLVTVAESLRG